MTAVCLTFILVDKVGIGLDVWYAPWIGIVTFLVSLLLFFAWRRRDISVEQSKN